MTVRLRTRMLYVILVLLGIAAIGKSSVCAEDQIQFNRDIRPILSENCYHCHGPDEDQQKAGLRLDTEDGAKDWAIVEGDASESEVYARVISDDAGLLMPPPDSERRLTDQQKQLIKRWIDGGAAYQKHWSFVPPVSQQVPKQSTRFDWGNGPIDRFIAAKIESQGLSPAPQADRQALIRRITFDLVGLPPTVQELDDYLADDSDQANEKLIDRLMADPRFGERMASSWLDVARYSDTYGFQVDRDRFVWPWRDWVVKAFNDNLAYDQFLTQQVAGDLLPGASQEQILATTFSRLHPQKVEGGSVPEEFRMEYVADRTQTVGTAFLGLTMECCRCHSHKYDPISHSEYYQLSAFFANVDEAGLYSYFTNSIPTPTLLLPTDAQKTRQESLGNRLARTEQIASEQLAKRPSVNGFIRGGFLKQSEGSSKDNLFATPIESVDFESQIKGANRTVPGVGGHDAAGKAVQLTGDDPINLKTGNFRRDQPFSISLWMKTPDAKDRAVVFHRSRAWTDAASRGYQLLIEDGKLSWSLIHFWPGNAIRIRAEDALAINQWVHVTVTNDGSSSAAGLGLYVNGVAVPTEVVKDKLTKNITGGGGDKIAIGQRFRDRGFKGGIVDQVRVFDVELSQLEIERLATVDETLDWVDTAVSAWNQKQAGLMSEHLGRRHDPDSAAAFSELGNVRKEMNELLDSMKEIMVMKEMDSPRQSFRLDRGAYDARAEPVQPGTPVAIRPLDAGLPRNRLGLAKWMTASDHPLTSRVAINRLWQLCFGIGLVRTPEDFGSQGQPPTHPELLDWLAVDFVESGWDIKRALKKMMLSQSYQLSSNHHDASVYQVDPENRLLTRHNAYRLPAEMLRDQSLAMSGQLVSSIGGPPVRPYEVEASFKPSKRDQGEGLYRRSLYTYWKRTGPAPAMMALDAAKRDVCRVRRERTSSPLQAFVLLNGPQYVEASRVLASELILQHGDDADSTLLDAFRTLTSRHPSADEMAVMKTLYQGQIEYFTQSPGAAKQYLDVGENRVAIGAATDRISGQQLAATSVVVGMLMNFDESVMKR